MNKLPFKQFVSCIDSHAVYENKYMQKDFDRWNERKKRVHMELHRPFYHEREIWWCALGLNVGTEQDGSPLDYRRPVLVIKSFGSSTCLVVPLTTSRRIHRLRIPVGRVAGKEATALLSQIRAVDSSRLMQKIGMLSSTLFIRIQKNVREIL